MRDDSSADNAATPVSLPPRYRFEQSLGEGGLGTVVKAYDTQLRVSVAIKTIRSDLATQDQQHYTYLRERFRREALAGARVRDSPHVVTVYDQIADSQGDIFLILQFMPGGTLRDRLRAGPLPVSAALRLIADTARGLQDLHDADLVHRDIKPENIFLAADGRALVGDLGIVQMSTTTFRTRLEYGSEHGHPGTPMYMSPEQEFSTGMLTPEADQYSLGAVLFELVTGKRYKQIYDDERAERLSGLPRPVADLIRRMTAEKPAERYRGMDALLTAIADIERNATVAAPPPPRVQPPPSRPPRVAVPAATVPEPRPVAPALPVHRPPARAPSERPIPRRAVLAGIGGVVVVGGAAAIWAVSQQGSPPVAPTATAASTLPPATATTAPSRPPATATVGALAPTATSGSPSTLPANATTISPGGFPVPVYQNPDNSPGAPAVSRIFGAVLVTGPAVDGRDGVRFYPVTTLSGTRGYIPEANIKLG